MTSLASHLLLCEEHENCIIITATDAKASQHPVTGFQGKTSLDDDEYLEEASEATNKYCLKKVGNMLMNAYEKGGGLAIYGPFLPHQHA